MAASEVVEAIPLAKDPSGIYRIGGTRIPLDTVLDAFDRGATPEEIVLHYDALQLPDVYQVIGYALKHPQEIAVYRRQRQAAISDLESSHPEWRPAGLRERLLARRDRP